MSFSGIGSTDCADAVSITSGNHGATRSTVAVVAPGNSSILQVLHNVVENCHHHCNDKLAWNGNGGFIVKDRQFLDFHIVPLLAQHDESFRLSCFEKQIAKYGFATTDGIVFRRRDDNHGGGLILAGGGPDLCRNTNPSTKRARDSHPQGEDESEGPKGEVNGTVDDEPVVSKIRTRYANGESAPMSQSRRQTASQKPHSEAAATVSSSSSSSLTISMGRTAVNPSFPAPAQSVSSMRATSLPSRSAFPVVVVPSAVLPYIEAPPRFPIAAEFTAMTVGNIIPQFIQDVVNYGIRNQPGVVSWYMDGFRVDDLHIFRVLVLPFSSFSFRRKRREEPSSAGGILREGFEAFEWRVSRHGFYRECHNGSLLYRPRTATPVAKTTPKNESLSTVSNASPPVDAQGINGAVTTKCKKAVLPTSVPRPFPLGDSSAQLDELVKNAVLTQQDLNRRNSNTIFVCGPVGAGKSTLAAKAVCDIEVRQCFSNGIGWINLGSNDRITSVRRLIRHYKLLVAHMQMTDRDLVPPQFDSVANDSDRAIHPTQSLERARSTMAHFMVHRRSLIVLDDLLHLEDVHWFNFQPSEQMVDCPYRVIVTSRTHPVSLHRVAQVPPVVVEVPKLRKETESIELPPAKVARRRDNEDLLSFMGACAPQTPVCGGVRSCNAKAAAKEEIATTRVSPNRGRYNEQMRHDTKH